MRVPVLETERLLIRPFVMEDLDAVYRLLDVELADTDGTEEAHALEERRRWLEWSVMNYEELAKLYQPPYGDRAVVHRTTGELIGIAGYAPCLNAFGLLPSWPNATGPSPACNAPEFGLYWAVSPSHQRRGYATEAARALID